MLSHYYCNGDGIVCLYTTNPVAIAYTHRQCFDVIFIHDEKLITKVLLTFFSLSLSCFCVCVCVASILCNGLASPYFSIRKRKYPYYTYIFFGLYLHVRTEIYVSWSINVDTWCTTNMYNINMKCSFSRKYKHKHEDKDKHKYSINCSSYKILPLMNS